MRNKASITIIFVAALALLGMSPVPDPSPSIIPSLVVKLDPVPDVAIEGWCKDVRASIKALKWNIEPCQGIPWKVGGASVRGRPIVYAEFGKQEAKNTTLVLSMVHGDEVTPLYIGIEIANWLREHQADLEDVRVVVAPLVNPDSFYRRPRTRVNANGVDVNRNFATADWHTSAHKEWKRKFRSNKRRFPGEKPRSEPETIFQEELVMNVKPQKILSIHAPLNFMDYDGPSTMELARFPFEYVKECMKLRTQLRAVSGGFFPGSLGNFAGQELGIPTLTLELPSANPRKAKEYWQKFSTGIRTMIQFVVPDYVSIRQKTPSS